MPLFLFTAAIFTAGSAQALPQIVRLRPAAPPAEAASEAPAADVQPPAPEQTKLPPARTLAGEWWLGIAGRSTRCRITLSAQSAGAGLSIASLGDNCPPSLFAVARWRLTPTELILATRSGQSLANLKPGKGGWSGPTRGGPEAMMEKIPARQP